MSDVIIYFVICIGFWVLLVLLFTVMTDGIVSVFDGGKVIYFDLIVRKLEESGLGMLKFMMGNEFCFY